MLFLLRTPTRKYCKSRIRLTRAALRVYLSTLGCMSEVKPDFGSLHSRSDSYFVRQLHFEYWMHLMTETLKSRVVFITVKARSLPKGEVEEILSSVAATNVHARNRETSFGSA